VTLRTLLFLCVLFHLSAHAENNLTISLINESSESFVFERAGVEFPDNHISIDTKVLRPNATATVSGSTSTTYDLSAVLRFKGGASFWIVDKLQCHVGPPLLFFVANSTVAKVISKTFNPRVGARLLSLVAAKVVITDG
jgi:hypothetical protein